MKRTTRLLSLALTPLAAAGALVLAPTPAHAETTASVGITATAVDKADGDNVLPSTGGTITDTIAFTGLQPAKIYHVEVYAHDPEQRLPMVKGTKYFITTVHGTANVKVDVKVDGRYAGRNLDLHPALYDGSHGIYLPVIVQPIHVETECNTSVFDMADGDRTLPAAGGTIVETAHFPKLIPGKAYRVDIWAADPTKELPPVRQSVEFYASQWGTATITVFLPVDARYAGKTLTVHEALYTEGQGIFTPASGIQVQVAAA